MTMRTFRKSCFAVIALLPALVACSPVEPEGEVKAKRPNILLVVADDLGFTDIGAFGGEIDTPTIDSLATAGLTFTNFHAAPNCSPTRAMMMSGTDNHIAGLGSMAELLSDNQRGQPGYEGHLNFRVASMPELFKAAGYNTFMAGKWHLGFTEETSPSARGFDHTFTLIEGGAGAFSNMLHYSNAQGDPDKKAFYREDGKRVEKLPEGFYSTEFYTDKVIEYVEAGRASGKPFLGYLAYTAPHWPLQAPRASIEKYRGKYDGGYDELRAHRLQTAQQLGLAPEGVEPFPRLLSEQPWDALTDEEKAYQARVMEVYAAMIDDVDRHLGRLIAHLKSIGEYENTVIFFMSDNGPEGHAFEKEKSYIATTAEQCCNNALENIGNADSYVWPGPNWSQASNVPMRMYKGFTGQGGIRVPAFIHYPGLVRSGESSAALLHVQDVLPTLLGLSGVEHPGAGQFMGREVVSMRGKSFVPILKGEASAVRSDTDFLAWELFGKRAIRQGDWKALYMPGLKGRDERLPGITVDRWQLYNLVSDPGEIRDLSKQHPGKLAELVELWDGYAEETGVILPERPISY